MEGNYKNDIRLRKELESTYLLDALADIEVGTNSKGKGSLPMSLIIILKNFAHL